MGRPAKFMRKDRNGKVSFASDSPENYPTNWPEVYAWLGKLDFLVQNKIPAYAGRCTSTPEQRISGVAFNGSTRFNLPPVRGTDVDLVNNKVCDVLEYERYGYLRPTDSVKFQEQAAINTIEKVASIFPDKFLVLNSVDACSLKIWPNFPEWVKKHNNGYDYYPSWFEKIVRIVAERTA